MFKQRSKIFFFTTIVETFLALSFLVISSINEVISPELKEALTIGTLYSYTSIQTTCILLVISSVLNLVGLIYKKRELITIGTIILIMSLVSDFLATLLLLSFNGFGDEKMIIGSMLCLLLLIVIIVFILLGFENQLKLLKTKKSK